jgi:hypothetical protein
MKTYLLPVLLMTYLGARVANAEISMGDTSNQYGIFDVVGCYHDHFYDSLVLRGGEKVSLSHMTPTFCIGLCGGAVSFFYRWSPLLNTKWLKRSSS